MTSRISYLLLVYFSFALVFGHHTSHVPRHDNESTSLPSTCRKTQVAVLGGGVAGITAAVKPLLSGSIAPLKCDSNP